MTTLAELTARIEALEAAAMSGDPHAFANASKAKLADVQEPAKLTDAKIKEISGDDGSDDAENSANKDVAEGLKEARSEAKEDAKPKKAAK